MLVVLGAGVYLMVIRVVPALEVLGDGGQLGLGLSVLRVEYISTGIECYIFQTNQGLQLQAECAAQICHGTSKGAPCQSSKQDLPFVTWALLKVLYQHRPAAQLSEQHGKILHGSGVTCLPLLPSKSVSLTLASMLLARAIWCFRISSSSLSRASAAASSGLKAWGVSVKQHNMKDMNRYGAVELAWAGLLVVDSMRWDSDHCI
jgi:hypothetical protein